MLKDVTLGRYYDNNSPLHRLDPRTKMLALVCYIVTVFLANTYLLCALSFAVLCLCICRSRVPMSYMLRGLRAVVVVLVVADLVNIFLVPDGAVKAFYVTLRMIEIVFASNLLSLTTRPKDMADGIEAALGPWSHDFATMLSIAMRFIPILSDEAQRIMDAQKARGADFSSGNIIKRAKALLPILVPLFVSAFRRSNDLALAMDSRLYGCAKASRLHVLKLGKKDYVFMAIAVAYLALMIVARSSL